MTLSCRELVELVTDYLEGALEPDERARFEQHLLVCDDCGRYLAQLRQTVRATGALLEADVSDEALGALRRAFAAWRRDRGGSDRGAR